MSQRLQLYKRSLWVIVDARLRRPVDRRLSYQERTSVLAEQHRELGPLESSTGTTASSTTPGRRGTRGLRQPRPVGGGRLLPDTPRQGCVRPRPRLRGIKRFTPAGEFVKETVTEPLRDIGFFETSVAGNSDGSRVYVTGVHDYGHGGGRAVFRAAL